MFGLPIPPQVVKYIGIALAVLALFGVGYYKGYANQKEKFDTYKAEVAALAAAQEEKTQQIDNKNQKLIKETKDAYNNQLANLRAYYGMRYNKSGGTMPQVPYTPGGANDYSPDNLPPTPILAGQCAETTLTLILLQQFITSAANNAE